MPDPPELTDLHAKRVLLIKPSSLGDVVQALPVLHALRVRFPRATLAWLISRACCDVLTGHPDLDEAIVFDREQYRLAGELAGPASGFFAFLRRLRRARFDLVVDLQGLLRSGVMGYATGAPRRVGLGQSREMAGRFYTDVVPVPTLDTPSVDRYWRVAEALGVGDTPRRFDIALPDEAIQWASERLEALARPLLVLSPGARWQTKRWPTNRFAVLADRFTSATGGHVVLVGSRAERPLADRVATATRQPPLNLAGETDLKQLGAVLAQADLMVTSDSGPMHMAAALGTSVVAIFTCTSPVRAGPYGEGHRVVASQTACAASYQRQCDRHMQCLDDLSVDRVWAAASELLHA